MNPRVSLVVVAAALSVCALLPAQKVPLPGDPQRCLQLIDLGEPAKGPDLVLVVPGESAPPRDATPSAELIAFVRAFVQPPLQAGDDVQVLGGRWLAVLARPEQGACAEQLVREARRRRDAVITVGVVLVYVDGKEFDRLLAPLLPPPAAPVDAPQANAAPADAKPPAVRQAVLDAAATATLHERLQAGKVEFLETPTLAVRPLEPATIAAMEHTTYVKDFILTKADASLVAEPVVGVVEDGVHIGLVATFTGKDHLGVSCTLTKSDLVRPIPKFSTTLVGGTGPVTIELPEVRTIRLQQTADLPPGGCAVIAAPKADGRWLIALVQATVQKQ